MFKRSTDLLIDVIHDSGQKILNYTVGLTLEQFTTDLKTVDAVIRNFELSEKQQTDYPKISKKNIPR